MRTELGGGDIIMIACEQCEKKIVTVTRDGIEVNFEF